MYLKTLYIQGDSKVMICFHQATIFFMKEQIENFKFLSVHNSYKFCLHNSFYAANFFLLHSWHNSQNSKIESLLTNSRQLLRVIFNYSFEIQL